ncbi:efflux transporter periplasmic adaptor subunit [Paramagnetospirillum kuznetsovii]|uniref:Efflux transporter periplasmic adaptor subunit n=1 Tax=Paramagnetospirillum kuznetsovii TaxID=2053833 RepID=A0A364NST1_9PROT|nr:efflux RND transporter periplasmic adaptor subunit [Paramagnetospirillum kuznetsovii]RAU20124.1 efflux transporter periplasmic adaptor subunit [Paramagnetospirillum kuznetsovii]
MSNASPRRTLSTPALLIGGVALLGIAAGLVSFMSSGSNSGAAAPPAGGPPVTVAAPLSRSVTDWNEFTGQFAAVDYVEVRARVSGYLTEIHFTDGQMVNKGDLLFVIDPRPYDVAVAAARAKLDQAQGGREYAKRQLTRADELRRKDFVAESTLDQRTEESRGANASAVAAHAALRDAELNLQFTRVTAPISGRIGAKQVSTGNLVSGGPNIPSPTLLTTIVSQDPIHITFDMSETDYLAQMRRVAAKPEEGMVGAPALIRLMDETGWPREGKLDFIDNQVDRGTGTIRARAVIANGDHTLTPGSFGRVRLAASAPYDALLVPDSAIVTDQSRKLVMTVKDGTVVPKPVKLGPMQDGLRVIRDGVAAEDQIIINGLMRARPGAKVTGVPGKIE